MFFKRWPIYIFNLVDITKLPCFSKPDEKKLKKKQEKAHLEKENRGRP